MATKQDWKETGKDLGHAFKGLGKTLIRTAKTGVDKVSDWANCNDDNDNKQTVEAKSDNNASADESVSEE